MNNTEGTFLVVVMGSRESIHAESTRHYSLPEALVEFGRQAGIWQMKNGAALNAVISPAVMDAGGVTPEYYAIAHNGDLIFDAKIVLRGELNELRPR